MRFAFILLSAVVSLGVVAAINEELVKKLENTLQVTGKRIKEIFYEWQVDKYPNFLNTASMHKSSLEVMKWKYMKKVLHAFTEKKNEKFVISFTGSSVTAGHDSMYVNTTTPNVQRIMQEPLAAAGLDFESRNVALGNNPCIPYDVCVKYFAGLDADVAVWEQNYFCSGVALEIFIRQAMTIPTQPIVAFSSSSTGNWGEDKCRAEPHKVSDKEKDFLNADIIRLVSDLNKERYHGHWGDLVHKDRHYHGAAVQAFTHHGHEDYACQGPYIKSWMQGAASWHPSKIAHRLRASQMSYFWLKIFELAVKELHDLASHRQLDAIKQDVDHHLAAMHPAMPAPLSAFAFPDNAVCYTDYEPRSVREVSLRDKAVEGLIKDDAPAGTTGWKALIYEDIVDKNLVKRSHENGYLDYKWLMYSKDNTAPLSLKVHMDKAGPLFLCETPGIWGKLPESFIHLRESKMELYVTYKADGAAFKFDKSKAEKQTFLHTQELDLCIQLQKSQSDKTYPTGDHVITIVPHEKENLILAWLITP